MTKSACSYSFFHSFILSFLLLVACTHRQETIPVPADSTGIDTSRLCVAVMPTMNCLPVYYAEKTGLADSLGLEMQVLRYQAQMDIDTAITQGRADIAYTDLIRIAKLTRQGVTISPFASTDEALTLVSLKTKRVKQVHQMKEQMVAVSRLSATDFWTDWLLDSTRTSRDNIYRPQVNDVRLRAEMLRLGLVDAAMLGEPYATWMAMLGHKALFQTKGKAPRLYAWANNSATKLQEKAFLAMLDSAITRMGMADQAAVLRDILKQDYQLPPALVDTFVLQPVRRPTDVSPADAEEAEKWLKKTLRFPHD